MAFYKFIQTQKILANIVAVWVFISNFENLKEITHSFMAFEVTGKPSA